MIEKSYYTFLEFLENRNNLLFINEGGTYGHMLHPYENLSLTFAQIKELTKLVLSGQLNKEDIFEKLDGVALAVSWKNGQLIAARNKSNFKNYGENALTVLDIIKKFADRGILSEAFAYAVKDLESAFSKLKEKDLQEIFEEGKRFLHLEIIYAKLNVIDYGVNKLVFHSIIEYDKDGNIIKEDKMFVKKLYELIKSVHAEIQRVYIIEGPIKIELSKIENFDKYLDYFEKKLNKIRKKFNLNEDAIIEDYLRYQFLEDIKELDKEGILSNYEIEGLLRRFVNDDRSFTLKDLSYDVKQSDLFQKLKDYDKNKVKLNFAKYIEPLKLYFLELGVIILKNIKNFLAVNPNKVVQNIKLEIEKTIKELVTVKDISKLDKIEYLLHQIEKLGGFDAIVSMEGIVFVYNGKVYKFTGAFALINQILGILKYE